MIVDTGRESSVLECAGKDQDNTLEQHKQAENAQDAEPMRKTWIYRTVFEPKVPMA